MYDNNGNIIKRREFAFTLKDATLIEELESTDNVDPNGNKWWHWVVGIVLVAATIIAMIAIGSRFINYIFNKIK